MEIPAVVNVYGKYHDKGMEVVGIDMDTDKAKMTEYTADHKMPWPQYF